MTAKRLVLRDVIDDDGLTRLPDLVADRGGDLQFAAGLEPEIDGVLDRAGDPAILGDPGDGGKTHSGGAANDLQDAWNRIHRLDGINIALKIARHSQPTQQCRADI